MNILQLETVGRFLWTNIKVAMLSLVITFLLNIVADIGLQGLYGEHVTLTLGDLLIQGFLVFVLVWSAALIRFLFPKE